MEEKTLYITLSSGITEEVANQLAHALVNHVKQNSVNHIYLLLNSPGGSVNAGVFLYNIIRSLGVKVTTHNIGQVDSITNVIFLAGDTRYAAPATTFLFHGVSLDIPAGAHMSRNALAEVHSQVLQDEKRIKAIVLERTSLLPSRLAAFFRVGRALSPDDALACGIVDGIKVADIPIEAEHIVATVLPKS